MIKQVAAIIITALLCWALHTVIVNRLDSKYKQALIDQAVKLTTGCNDDKKLTEEASNEYQAQITDLNQQLARAKRVQPNHCVAVTPGSSRRPDVFTKNEQLSHEDGVYSDDLLDFAADCEATGRQLDGLQSFVKNVWQSRNK